ncbi:hypothetical protein GQ42DRAFT_159534 [Ramicandelaber brevisporus]|nr:hypothetical protein GQ42DRAFT_159534 [Ramicandelaber brevisporus]
MESSSRRRDLRSSGHHSSSRSSSSSRGSSSSSRYDTRLDRGRSSSRGDRERTSQKQHSSSQQSARQQSTLNVRDVSYINEAHVVTIRRLFNHLGPIIDHLNLISGRLSLLGKRQFIGLNKERFDFLSAFLSTKAAPSHIAQLYRELVRTEQTQPDQSVQQLGLFSDNRSIIAQNFKRIHWWLERCDWQARLDTQFANLYKVRTTIAWQCKCNAKKSAVQHVIDIFPYQDCSLQDLLGGSKSHCPKCGVNINHYFTFGSAPQFILLTVNNGGHCTITMDESVEITIRENDDGVEGLRAEVKYLVDCVVYYDHNDRVYNLATRHNNEWVKRNNRGNVAPIHDSRFSQFVNIVVLRRIGPVDSNTSFRSSSNSSLYDHVKAQLQPRDCASDIVAASTSVSVGSSEVDASAAIDSGLLNIDSGVPPLHYISHPSPGSHSALPLHPYLDTHVSSAGNGNSTACDHIAAVPSSSPVLLFGDTPALESANSGKLVINASEQSHQHSPTATATERPQVVSFSEYIARRSRLALIMKDTVSQQQLSIGSETATYTDVGSRSNNLGITAATISRKQH